jgi:hypothetical protein
MKGFTVNQRQGSRDMRKPEREKDEGRDGEWRRRGEKRENSLRREREGNRYLTGGVKGWEN